MRLGSGEDQLRLKHVKLRQENRQEQSPYFAYRTYRKLEKERIAAAEALKMKTDSLYAAYNLIEDSATILEDEMDRHLIKFQDQRLGSFKCLWKWSLGFFASEGELLQFEEWISYFEENRADFLRKYQSIYLNAKKYLDECDRIKERLDRERYLLETARWKRARELRTDTMGLSLNLSQLGRYTIAQEFSYLYNSSANPGQAAVLQIDRYEAKEEAIAITRVILLFDDRVGIYTTEGLLRFGPYKLPVPFARATILAQDESGHWHHAKLFEKGEQKGLVIELEPLEKLDDLPGLSPILRSK